MPLVPALEAPSVQAESLPGRDNPKFDTSVPDTDAPIASGLQAVADAGVAEQAKYKQQNDQLRVIDATMQLRAGQNAMLYGKDQEDGTRSGGVFSLRGTNAVNLPAKVLPQYDQLAGSIASNLTADQQKLFQAHIIESRAETHMQLERYEAQEADRTANAIYENGSVQTVKSAALGWRAMDSADPANPSQTVGDRYRADLTGIVKMQADREGWSPEQQQQVLSGKLADLHKGVIAQMLTDDSPAIAAKYLDSIPRGELQPGDEQHLRNLVDVGRAGAVSDPILQVYQAQGPTAGAKAFAQLDKMDLPNDVKDMARSNIQKGLGLWRDEQRQKYSDAIEKLHENIASGNASGADIATAQTLYRNGAAGAEETGSTIGAIERALKKKADDEVPIAMVAEARAAGRPLHADDKDVQAAVDAYAQRQTKGMVPGSNQYATEVSDITTKVGVVPKSAVDWANTQLVGGDADSAAKAADLMARLQEANPRALGYASDNKRTSVMADSIANAITSGTAPETAVQNARDADSRSDAKQKVLEQRWAAIKANTGVQPSESALRAQLSSNPALKAHWWSGVPNDANGHLPSEMVGDFEGLTHDYFEKNGGDLQQARRLAARDVQNVWALSSVNGSPQLMKFAPEATTGLPSDVIRDHFESFVKVNGSQAVLPDPKTGRPVTTDVDPKSAKLVPVPETARTNGRVWGIVVATPDGGRDTLVDKNGKAIAYRLPDKAAAAKVSETAALKAATSGMATGLEDQSLRPVFDQHDLANAETDPGAFRGTTRKAQLAPGSD